MKARFLKLFLLLLPTLIFVNSKSWSQSIKYPVVKIEGKDSVVVMTVKQADAINTKYKTQEIIIDSLKKITNQLNKQIDSLKSNTNTLKSQIDNLKDYSITLNKTVDSLKTLKPQTNCDSLTYVIKDWAYKPTLVYYYNDKIHALDLSLYKIRFTIDGVIEITKLTKKEMSQYHQLLHSGGYNLVDWRKEFIKYDLPLIEDIDKLK